MANTEKEGKVLVAEPKDPVKKEAVEPKKVTPTIDPQVKDLKEQLEKAEETIKRRDKSLREVRAEKKELEDQVEEQKARIENNDKYLKSLTKRLDDAEEMIATKGKALQEVITTVSGTFDVLEITLNNARKAIQFNLQPKPNQNRGE